MKLIGRNLAVPVAATAVGVLVTVPGTARTRLDKRPLDVDVCVVEGVDLTVVEGVVVGSAVMIELVSNTRPSSETVDVVEEAAGVVEEAVKVVGEGMEALEVMVVGSIIGEELVSSTSVPENTTEEVESTEVAAGVEAAMGSDTLEVVTDIKTVILVELLAGATRTGVGWIALTHPVFVLVTRVDTDGAGGAGGADGGADGAAGSAGRLLAAP